MRTTSWSTASGLRHDRARTPAEIAAIRRRYLLMATSAAGVDIAFTLVFIVPDRRLELRAALAGRRLILLLGAVNYLSRRRRLFAPIERYLKGEASFEDTQRRITQLPLLTAQPVAILMLVLTLFRLGSTYFFTRSGHHRRAAADHRPGHHALHRPAGLLFHLHLLRHQRLPRRPLHLHLPSLRPQSRALLRQLQRQADRRPGGDLDRAHGGDHRRPLLL